MTIQIVEVYHRNPSNRDNFSVEIDNKGYYFQGGYDYGAFQSSNSVVTNVTNATLNYDFYQVARTDLTEIPIYFFGYSDRCDGDNGHYFKYNNSCYCGLFGSKRCSDKDDYNYESGWVSIKFWEFLNNNQISDWVYTNGGAHGFRFILSWQPFAPTQLNYEQPQYCGGQTIIVEAVYNVAIWNTLSDYVKDHIIFHWYYVIQPTRGPRRYEFIKSTSYSFLDLSVNNISDSTLFKAFAVRVEFNGVLNPTYRFNRVPIEILPNPPSQLLFSLKLPNCYNEANADIVIDSIVGKSNSYFLNVKRGETVLYQSSVMEFPFSVVNLSAINLNNSVGLISDYYILSTTNYHNSVLGCSRIDTIFIPNKEPIQARFQISNYNGYSVSCNGYNNAYLSISARGGNGSYTSYTDSILYNFDSSDRLVLGNLSASSKTFTITDNLNCPSFDTVILLSEPLPLISKIHSNDIDCYGNYNGKIFLDANGGVGAYQYFIDTYLVVGSTIYNLESGDYSIRTEDKNGCFVDTLLIIYEPPPIDYSILSVNNPQCYGVNDGSLLIGMSGGVAPYSYWINNKTYQQGYMDSLFSGENIFILKDFNQCQVIDSVELISPDKITITSLIQSESCFNKRDGYISYNISGGVRGYSVFVNNERTDDSILANLGSGDYVFRIIDDHYCEVIDTVKVIGAKENIFLSINNIVSATCHSISNGEVNLELQGGESPYKINETVFYNSNIQVVNLNSGYNRLVVLDSLHCEFIDSVYIPIEIDLRIPFQDSVFVCSTQEFVFSDTSSFDRYWNTTIDVPVDGDSILMPNQWYKVYTIENQHHCTQLDSFIVIPLTDYVNATFLISSVVYQRDTIFLIDINTTAVDSINISSALDVSQLTDRRWYIISSDTGDFDIRFKAYSGLCSDELIKTVHVKSDFSLRSVIDDPLGYQGFLNLIIYPNPFQSMLYCQGELAMAGNIDLTLWDVLGNIIIQKSMQDVTTFEIELETYNLPPGVYFIQLSTLDEMVRIKLMKDQN
ncbi:MAG: T9SS type A sorting domain-containing protein [Cytophagaceae bacterium]